jgi:membrane-associated phospholipid phosphatase
MVIAICTLLWQQHDRHENSLKVMVGVASWAGLVGLARVCLGRHYISDVLAGFTCGVIEVGIGSWLFPKLKFLNG